MSGEQQIRSFSPAHEMNIDQSHRSNADPVSAGSSCHAHSESGSPKSEKKINQTGKAPSGTDAANDAKKAPLMTSQQMKYIGVFSDIYQDINENNMRLNIRNQ